jgi:hypothetical protein
VPERALVRLTIYPVSADPNRGRVVPTRPGLGKCRRRRPKVHGAQSTPEWSSPGRRSARGGRRRRRADAVSFAEGGYVRGNEPSRRAPGIPSKRASAVTRAFPDEAGGSQREPHPRAPFAIRRRSSRCNRRAGPIGGSGRQRRSGIGGSVRHTTHERRRRR